MAALTTAPVPAPAADPLVQELAALKSLELDALRLRWRKLTRRTAPPALRRDLLARLLASELQTRAYGGLSRDTARLLEKLARGDDPARLLAATGAARMKPGTQLVREHAGVLHTVTVTANGYAWNGAHYASLSQIASSITGTRWNGPRFFGLRDKAGAGSRQARP